jgi:hypothetical protein
MHQMVKLKTSKAPGFKPRYAVQNTECPGVIWVIKPVTRSIYDVVLVDVKEHSLGPIVRGYSHVEPNLSVEEILTELSRVEKVMGH